jgi:hypothetical protein
MKNPNMTTIWISKDTKAKLQSLMSYGETYDGILRFLLETNKRDGIPLTTKDYIVLGK